MVLRLRQRRMARFVRNRLRAFGHEVVRGLLKLPRQAETMKLYRNNRKGGFEDVTAR